MISNSQLALDLSTNLSNWQTFLDNLLEWQTGDPNGGAALDGEFDLIKPNGNFIRVKGLRRLIQEVTELVDEATGAARSAADAQALAELAQALTETYRDMASRFADDARQQAGIATAAANEAESHRVACRTYRDEILGFDPGRGLVNVIEVTESYSIVTQAMLGSARFNVIHIMNPTTTIELPPLTDPQLISFQDVAGTDDHTILRLN